MDISQKHVSRLFEMNFRRLVSLYRIKTIKPVGTLPLNHKVISYMYMLSIIY